jgi:hypothetical protein
MPSPPTPIKRSGGAFARGTRLVLAKKVDGHAHSHAVKPSPHRRAHGGSLARKLEEDLLRGVFRIGGIHQHAASGGEDHVAMLLGQVAKCLGVAILRPPSEQFLFGRFGHVGYFPPNTPLSRALSRSLSSAVIQSLDKVLDDVFGQHLP